MLEKINGVFVELRQCATGYSIEVDHKQVMWIKYKSPHSEAKAEIAFSTAVRTLGGV